MNCKLTSSIKVNFYHFVIITALLSISACAGVNTFPTVARQGDTVSVMVGGSEKANKNTISATMTDSNNVVWDLVSLGLVRSVFNLRADGLASGNHYSHYIEIENPWTNAHEPIQTVLVFDVPVGAAEGVSTLSLNLNTDDDSSGVVQPFSINLEVLPSLLGSQDQFLRQDFSEAQYPLDFTRLEQAPYAKISFGTGTGRGYVSATPNETLGAAEMIIDFDDTIVSGNDINVYVPESTQRGDILNTGQFGDHQRMVSWKIVGNQLHIYVIAPKGIEDKYLQVYIIHPQDLPSDPMLNLISTTGYDLNGNEISATPQFSYHP